MSLAFEDDKILTSNPFIDILLYNLKILAFNSIIKDQSTADNKETLDSLKNADLYIACMEKHAEVALFPYIPHDILVQAGVPENQIQLYERNDEYDSFYLPKEYHEAILNLAQPWFINNYVEQNEYYRLITGLPPLGDPGIPMRDYEYLLADDLLDYTGEYLHETGTDFCKMLDNMGILDIIKADFPDAKYLNYVTQGLDLYTVRKKMDFQILYYPTTCDLAVTQEFLFKYEENRKYVLQTVYSSAMELESEYYHSFMMIYLVLITMIDMLMEVQSHIVKKDILDRRCIQYIFSIYGIPYYRVIPYKYQERMCKNVWSLVKYKSCTQEMLNLIDLFGFDDIHIFKYYLLKVRKTNAWGEFEYNTSKKLVCRYNDIIEHTTLTENMSDPSTQPPIPPNLDWYEDKTNTNSLGRIVDNSDKLIKYNDKDKVISSTLEALDNDGLNEEYRKSNNDFISTLAEGDTVRYINYPFDYFLQKGNVMFVKLDGRVLVEDVDYTISNYNTITFHNGIADNAKVVEYEFYYDKETVDKDFIVDTDHAIEMETKQWKNCKANQTFELDPVPWGNFFPYENQVIISVSSVWLPPALYSVDYENHVLSIDSSVAIEGRIVTVLLLYSKSLRTQYEIHNVEAVQEEQTDFFIPEPFQHYCLNENGFFVTMGSIYVNQDRYTVEPSTEAGRSLLKFIDGTRVPRGRSLSFNFLYSTNAIWNPLVVETKTIHIVATQFYQTQFDIDFPVDNYLDCRYKVFIKLLGWYLSEEMFEIVGNGITFMDQSIALQPGDEMDVILVYVPVDRSSGKSNIKVSTDYRVAEQDKQSKYDIIFPTDHYHTKGNVVLVDVEGIQLQENTDYTIDYNDAGGGKEGTVTLLTYDYKPMEGQRVNYTFYYNQDAEYYSMLEQQQIPIESPGQNTFTLEFPFFPYVQTGNSLIVMSGSTMVTSDRISWVDQFNIKIEGLDPEDAGGYITVLYIYNNYYLLNQEPDLIVEWKDAAILDDIDYVEMPTPFEDYVENDWPYFVTYGDRQWIDEDKYEVYDDSWYPNPLSDKSKYGYNITFTFIYLKREPWIVEVDEEDYSKDMDLVFCKIPIEDLYSSQYLKDPVNYKSYDSVVMQDGWWDGYQYKQNNHQLVIDDIYRQKFNYARSKYYGLFQTMDVVKYSSMISYFYSILYDDVFLEEELKIKVESLSPYHTFRLADLFIYMTCLTYIFNDMDDFVLDQPTKIMFVQGFNFKASFKELKKYLRYHHEEEDDFPIWDFIIPTSQIKDLEEFMNILKTDWDVRQRLVQYMIDSEDYREYHIWKHMYDALMKWQLNFKFFTLENGQVATTYTEFLKEKDSVLYNSLQEIKAMGNYEEKVDKIISIVDDIVYVLDEFINGEWDCVFDRFPGQSPTDALKYLLLVISFFKSYKIVFFTKGVQMEIGGGNKPDEECTFKGYDLCRIRKTDNIITYYPLVEDVKTTRHLGLSERSGPHENGKWMREDWTIITHARYHVAKDIDGIVNIEKEEFMKDLLSGSLIIEKQEFWKDLFFEDPSVTINKEDFEYVFFGNNGSNGNIRFEYVPGDIEEDIDSDTNINKEYPDPNDPNYNIDGMLNIDKEDFFYDLFGENSNVILPKRYANYDIDTTLNMDKLYIDPNDPNYNIDGNLNIDAEYPDIDDDRYIIDGVLNIDKLYPTDQELEDHYTITGDAFIDREEIPEEDLNGYTILGMVNIDKLYPSEEDLMNHYTISVDNMIYEQGSIDPNDTDYIINGNLNIDAEYPSEDDDRYIIDGTFDYAQSQVDPEDTNYIIDGMLNVDKLYPTDEELEDHYTIDGMFDYTQSQVSEDDPDYIIDGILNVDKLYATGEELDDYSIDGTMYFIKYNYIKENVIHGYEFTYNSSISRLDTDIDSTLNMDKLYPTEEELKSNYTISVDNMIYEQGTIDKNDEDYIIAGNLNIDAEYPTEEELESDYTITGDMTYSVSTPSEDDTDYIIDSTLSMDKLYPTEEELESNYTINSDMELVFSEVDPEDNNYIIEGTFDYEQAIVDENDEDYIITGILDVDMEEIPEEDLNGYSIDGTLNINKEYPEEDDMNYIIDSEVLLTWSNSLDVDIDSDLNIDKQYPTEDELKDRYDISADIELINTEVDPEDDDYIIAGNLNVDLEELTSDIDSTVDIDREEIPEEDLNGYSISGMITVNAEYPLEDDEAYIITGELELPDAILFEQDILEGNLIVNNDEFNINIDSEVSIDEESIDSDIPVEFNINNLEFTIDIDGELDIVKEYPLEDDEDYIIEGSVNMDDYQELTTDIDGTVNMDDFLQYISDIISGDLNIDNEEFSSDLDSDVSIDEYETTGDIEGSVSIDRESITVDIDGSTNIDEESTEEDIDGSVDVDGIEVSEDIDGTVSLVQYVKQNVIKGYEFSKSSSGGGVQLDIITGALEYQTNTLNKDLNSTVSTNRTYNQYDIDSETSINENRKDYYIDSKLELDKGYEGFSITSVNVGTQQGIVYKGQESLIAFPVYLTVSDSSHLQNLQPEDLNVNINMTYITEKYFSNISISGNNIHAMMYLKGIWNSTGDSIYYNIYIQVTDDTNITQQIGTNISIELNEPLNPLPGSVRIDSSTDAARRILSSSNNGTEWVFTTSYTNWDVYLTDVTMNQIDLDSIQVTIADSTNTYSYAGRTCEYKGYVSRGGQYTFGFNFDVTDAIQNATLAGTNIDYTLNVVLPAGDGYTGSISTQFVIKVKITS